MKLKVVTPDTQIEHVFDVKKEGKMQNSKVYVPNWSEEIFRI